MKRNIIAILAFFPGCVLAAQDGGVYETNYAVGSGYSDEKNASAVSVSSRMSFPVYQNVGASLSVSGQQSIDVEEGFSDSRSYSLIGDLFLRDFNLGKLGLRASYSETHLDNVPGGLDDDLSISNYALYARYYLDDFTLGITRGVADPEGRFENQHLLSASLAWYWRENTQLQFLISGMDAKDQYFIGVTHQPSLFNNSTSVHFGYQESPDNDILSLSMSYYFGNKISLKDRDRKYR